MTFIPWPNGIQLCFDFVTAGQNWQFCLALRKSTGSVTPTDLAAITTAADTWQPSLMGYLDQNTTLRQIRATDMTAQGGQQSVLTVGDAGTNGNAPMPIGTAQVVSLRTAKRGRSYRGRMFLGGLSTAYLLTATDSTAASAALYGAAVQVLAGALDALGYDHVVPSKQHNGAVTNPAELNEVIAYVVDQHYDSQRRRLAGRGT